MRMQPVSILSRRDGAFPAQLKVLPDGSIIHIDAVERCWTEMNRQRGSVAYVFRVRSGERRYRLSEDSSGCCLLFADG